MEGKLMEALQAHSNIYSGWILWNLFLAFIPLALSFWLFRRKTPRTTFWWIVYIVFIAFLPNAPYLLTDIIHLIRGVRLGYSAWLIALIFLPVHLFAIISGFEAYVVSLINQDIYLKRQGAAQFIFWSEISMHVLCAVGVYMGRFRRFNSWDLVTDPGNVVINTIDDLTSKRPLVVIFVTFLILTAFYWFMKQVTLGLVLRFRLSRAGDDGLPN